MARLTYVLILLFCVVLSYAKSATKLFEEANNLYEQGKKAEGNALFIKATEIVLQDTSAQPIDKISSAITAFKIAPFNKKRHFLLSTVRLANEHSLHYLIYEDIEQIHHFYYQLSYTNSALYDSLKTPAYRYEYVRVNISSIDSISTYKYAIKVNVNETMGFNSNRIYLETTIDDVEYFYDGTILSQNDTFTVYQVDASEQQDFKGFGEQTLLVANCKIPEYTDFIENLYLLQAIQFTGNYKEKLHSYALLLSTDYATIKPLFNQFYVDQISEVYDAYKGDSVLGIIPTSGAFKNQSLEQSFANTSYQDINLFFDFVSNFSGKYYAKSWNISEVYATWIINNAPLSEASYTNLILKNKDSLSQLLLRFKDEIYENNLFGYWQKKSLELENEFKYQEAIDYQKLLLEAAQLFTEQNWTQKSATKISDLYLVLNHFQAAAKYGTIANVKDLSNGLVQSNTVNFTTKTEDLNVVVQYNHSTPYQLAYHPNGRYYYTVGWDGKIKVWDAGLNKLIREYGAHETIINALEASSDGNYLVTADDFGLIKIWKVSNSSLELATSYKHKYSINEVHFCNSPGANIIAFCGGSKAVWLYDWKLNKTKKLEKHTKNVTALAFNATGTLLYSGGRDSLIYKWPISKLHTNWNAKIEWDHWYKEPGQVFQLEVSNNNRFFSAVLSDSSMVIWDTDVSTRIGYVSIHMTRTASTIFYSPIAFAPNNKFLVFANAKNDLSIIDLDNFKFQSYFHNQGNLVSDIDFHPNSKILATTSYDMMKTKFWDLSHYNVFENNSLSTKQPSFTSTKAYEINFDSTGTRLNALLSSYSGPLLTTLDITNGQSRLVYDGVYHVETKNPNTSAFINWYGTPYTHILKNGRSKTYKNDTSIYGNYKYVVDEDAEILYLYDARKKPILMAYDMVQNQFIFKKELNVDSVSEWRSGLTVIDNTIFLTAESNRIYRFNATTGKELKPLKTGLFNMVYYLERIGENQIAICNKWNFKLYDVRTSKTIWKHKYRNWKERKDGEMITRYKVSADGKYLAFADYYYNLYVFNKKANKEILIDSSSNWFINAIAFHPNKPILAFCNEENKIRFIDFNNNQILADLYPQTTGSFIWLNHENYYWAKKQDLENIAFEMKGKVYPAEQFDVTFNRPDKVMEAVPTANKQFVNALHLAIEKRLNNHPTTSNNIAGFPNVNVKNKNQIPQVTKDSTITLKIEAFDFEQILSKLIITSNGVLINEIELTQKEFDSVINIPLAVGSNNIKVWVENNVGLTSLKESILTQKSGTSKTNLYLFALSVSKYEDSKFNLKYAVKDGRDLINAFTSSENK